MTYIRDDLKKGKRAETKVQKPLEDMFGKLTQDPDPYASFDFYNDNYLVEHKQRTHTTFKKYDSLMFEYHKYQTYLERRKENPRLRFFIVWSLKDGRYIWEFQDQFRGDDAVFYTSNMKIDRGDHLQKSEVVKVFNEEISNFNEFYL